MGRDSLADTDADKYIHMVDPFIFFETLLLRNRVSIET